MVILPLLLLLLHLATTKTVMMTVVNNTRTKRFMVLTPSWLSSD